MASTYLQRTTSTPTSDKKGTISFWIKRNKLSSDQHMANIYVDGSNRFMIKFQSDDSFVLYNQNSGTGNMYLESSQKFRDVSSFYHVVCKIDTTQSTASNRAKVYINGSEISYAATTYPNQNDTIQWFQASKNQQFGQYNSSNYLDAVMSHVHYTDGYAYDASTFGSTDSVTGQWKINTSPSITMGNNGFTILKDGNTITDQSSNSNNFTVGGGTLTKTEDSPSNVFCTWNAINPFGGTLTNGNLTVGNSSSYNHNVQGSLGMEKGKFYWEYKMTNTHGQFGVCENCKAGQADPQSNIGFYFLYNNGNTTGTIFNNVSGSSSSTITVSAFANGMILGCAYDADNEALYIHQNGTYVTSGDPTSGASKTGAIITNLRARYGGTIVPLLAFGTSGARTNFDANFGNGYFGTTAVASAGSNASGNGIFEYNVPTGYTALSTKGLNL